MILVYKSRRRNLSEGTNIRDNESLEEQYSKGETSKITNRKLNDGPTMTIFRIQQKWV